MRWMSVVLVTALLGQVLYLPCSAQEKRQDTFTIAPGAWVRIKAPSVSKRWLIGKIVTINADTLMLRSEKQATPLAISLASMTELEVSQGRKSNAGKGRRIGLLAGAGIGFPLGYAIGEEEVSRGTVGARSAVFFGYIGLLVGAIIGSGTHTDKWQEVPLDRIRLSISPQRHGGLTAGARVRITRGRFASLTRLKGIVERMDANTLVVLPDKRGASQAISFASMTRLEVSQGKKGNILKGAGKGLLIGAGVGGLTGLMEGGVGGAVLFAIVSGELGLLIGAAMGIPRERWEEVPLERIQLGLLPQRHGGLALSASFSF